MYVRLIIVINGVFCAHIKGVKIKDKRTFKKTKTKKKLNQICVSAIACINSLLKQSSYVTNYVCATSFFLIRFY